MNINSILNLLPKNAQIKQAINNIATVEEVEGLEIDYNN